MTTTQSSLPRLVDLVETIRQVDTEMPAQTLLTLLVIAEAGQDGIYQHEIGQKLGLSATAAWRNITNLSSFEGPGSKALGLIDVEIPPEHRRYRRLRLSSKGVKFVEKLKKLMD